MMLNMKKLLIISLITLSACSSTYEGMTSGMTEDSRNIRARIADNIYPEQGPYRTTTGNYAYPPVYCYKTWTDNVCYDTPQPETGK
jgi:hypothetical protein